MNKRSQSFLFAGLVIELVFVLWTVLVKCVDVRAVGPQDSCVGFATMNGYVHELVGVNMTLYNVTDFLGLVPFCFISGFALVGLIQLIKRKNLFKVDTSILILGVFYIVVMAVYVFFEFYVVNCRPVLIEGYLEASYPSSTTMLVMCVMPTAILQLNSRITKPILRKAVALMLSAFTCFMVVSRFICGVHWVSDIIGGLILSTGLVMIYYAVTTLVSE